MAMLNHAFFEIGCEELPAGFLATVPKALRHAIEKRLDALGVEGSTVEVEKTPRRVVIRVHGLPETQAERTEVIKGPPLRVAFDSQGTPTQALNGFLRKNNATFDACTQETMGDTRYVVLHQRQAGQAIEDLIGPLVLEAVMSLEGPRFMRWANNTRLFPRPIRWLLAFWNDAPLPLALDLGEELLHAQHSTRGHRLLGQAEITVDSPADYEAKLATLGKVILSTEARRILVKEQLAEVAQSIGGVAIVDDELLEEVANLLEYPSVILGHFDERYLKIPKPVLITVMKTHQRYFPVQKASGELLPYFLVATNGDVRFAENIIAGNERVLVARFEDAKFFYEDDIKTPLQDRLDALDGVTFQKGLGSLKAKTQRIQRLSYAFAEALALDADTRQAVERAALLCKTDLVTSMVFELTELQGEVGLYYALEQGESPAVAQAIFEHYLPRFQGDALPESPAGLIISLADKLDTLVALFSQHHTKMPSGSKDPLGLRRLVNGVLLSVLAFNLHNDLQRWCHHSYENLGDLAQESWEATWQRTRGFMQQRLASYLQEQGYGGDLIQAVQASFNPWQDLPLFVAKLDALKVKREDAPDLFHALYTPANRIDKMIAKHYNPKATLATVEESLLESEAERALYHAATKALIQNSTVAMAELAPVVERFFEEVMVMSENPAIRQNRLDLLSALHTAYLQRYGRLSLLSGM
jgi:glycyl-tRNA synthetase beta chain